MDADDRATGDPELPYPARGLTPRSEETRDGGTPLDAGGEHDTDDGDAWEVVDDLVADGWDEDAARRFAGLS